MQNFLIATAVQPNNVVAFAFGSSLFCASVLLIVGEEFKPVKWGGEKDFNDLFALVFSFTCIIQHCKGY